LERLERRVEKIEDKDAQASILVELKELRRRVDRMATFAMSAGALLAAVLGILIRVLLG
jgi:hypothetical protein